MKLGLMCGAEDGRDATIDSLIEFAKNAESKGFDHLWMAHIFFLDAITTLSIIARETNSLRLGTAVVPSFPRHPTALAQQSLTAQAASNGRFTLGLGLSHKLVIENMFGLSYDKPAKHMQEYLDVLMPLMRGEECSHHGDLFNVALDLTVNGATPTPVVVAALGPKMLDIAGKMADGTTTWMTGPKTLETHIIPTISEAANSVGKPSPRIVAGLPVIVTNDTDSVKEIISKRLKIYGELPSYRSMLDIEGNGVGPADVSLIGDEAALRPRIQQLRDIGVTDFNAAIFPIDNDTTSRTIDFLASEIN